MLIWSRVNGVPVDSVLVVRMTLVRSGPSWSFGGRLLLRALISMVYSVFRVRPRTVYMVSWELVLLTAVFQLPEVGR